MHLLTKLILISSSSQQEYQNTFLMFSPSNIITNIDEIPFIGATMALRSVIKFVNLVLIICGSFNECAIVLHSGKLSEKLSNKKTNRLTPISSILLINIIMIVSGMNNVYHGFGGRIASSSGKIISMNFGKFDFECISIQV